MRKRALLSLTMVVSLTFTEALGFEGVLTETFPPEDKQQPLDEKRGGPSLQKIGDDDLFYFEKPPLFRESYANLLQFKAGPFRPQAMTLQNESYRFDYPAETLKTFLIEGSWERRLFSFYGQESLNIHLGYALVQAKALIPNQIQRSDLKNHLHMIPLGLSLTYAIDLWERQWIIPVAEVAANSFFYIQFGDTTGAYVDGATLNPHWSLGVRFPLHHIVHTLLGVQPLNPYFLETHYRKILGKHSAVDFSQEMILAGLSIGI